MRTPVITIVEMHHHLLQTSKTNMPPITYSKAMQMIRIIPKNGSSKYLIFYESTLVGGVLHTINNIDVNNHSDIVQRLG